MASSEAAEKAEIEREFRKSLPKARMMMGKNMMSKEEGHKLYGLFQQAVSGNCNDWKVLGSMNFVDLEAKSKVTAWIANRGVSKTEAMQKYAAEVNQLAEKYGCTSQPQGSSFKSRYQNQGGASSPTSTGNVISRNRNKSVPEPEPEPDTEEASGTTEPEEVKE